VSEFYVLRRRAIKDITALIAFVIGWFGSAPFGWPYITAGFDGGNVTKGVAQFLVIVFGGACLAGIGGLMLGAGSGWVWEQIHRRIRPPEKAEAPTAAAREAEAHRAARAALPPLPPIRYADDNVRAEDYIALAQRVAPGEYLPRKVEGALEKSINISAWDGARLIGIVRVLSDGYFFAAAPDILVDPDYQRRGVGRELMNRAFERTPRGALFVGARGNSAGFFERLGCERGPAGFTMTRRRTS
jgi:GNAT superfamily N-acetyltransferase